MFDVPLLERGAQAACEASPISHNCVYLMQEACSVKSGVARTGVAGLERHGADRRGGKGPAHIAPGPRRSLLFSSVLANGSTLQPAESDAPHNMALQRQEEDDDRNDSQSRAGHLQLILVALLHAQVGNRDRELLL